MSDRLETVDDYVKSVRTLLNDKIEPFRYSDNDIVKGLNMALLEVRRIRADLLVTRHGNRVPSFVGNSGAPVPIEPQFRLGLEYLIAAQVLLRDEEDVQDARANSFKALGTSVFIGVQPPPIQGGTPAPASAQR